MTRRPALAILVLVHLLVVAAELLAPAHYARHNRELAYAPPTPLRLADARGGPRWPFVYRLVPDPERPRAYREDRSRTYPLRFWVRSEPYRIFGLVPAEHRLLGVDPPARLLLMGTDGFGRDVFARWLHGGRVSLFAGLLAAALALGVGLALGSLSGFYGGRVDALLMRLTELVMALPWLYLLLAVRAFLPLRVSPVQAFFMLVTIIGLVGWARPARLIRGVALSARERDYVRAARGFGASDGYLLTRHVLPQTLGVALTQGAVLVPRYILAEVTLSFLGLGIAEPVPSWGNMLAELQRYHVLVSGWWWLTLPALALVAVVLCYHLLARELQAAATIP